MFKKGKKYQGEVWLPNKENERSFCILKVTENQVYLETNLHDPSNPYKIDVIRGSFNDLGHLTFVDNLIQSNTIGVVLTRVYATKYTFNGNHFIEPETLKLKNLKFHNNILTDWRRNVITVDFENNKIDRKENLNKKIRIEEVGLTLEISTYPSYTTNSKFLKVSNNSFITFHFDDETLLIKAIEEYNHLQRFFYFIYGKTNHFDLITFNCINCEDKFSLHYKDSLVVDKRTGFISLDFEDVNSNLEEVIINWFKKPDLKFCVHSILESALSIKISNSRRFINSIFSVEAFTKRFKKDKKKDTLENLLLRHKKTIMFIANKTETELKGFTKKIVQTRNYYVHSNLKQTNYFTEFELLYISILLDYTVGIEILREMGFEEDVIIGVMNNGKIIYKDSQALNYHLNDNIIDNPKDN